MKIKSRTKAVLIVVFIALILVSGYVFAPVVWAEIKKEAREIAREEIERATSQIEEQAKEGFKEISYEAEKKIEREFENFTRTFQFYVGKYFQNSTKEMEKAIILIINQSISRAVDRAIPIIIQELKNETFH